MSQIQPRPYPCRRFHSAWVAARRRMGGSGRRRTVPPRPRPPPLRPGPVRLSPARLRPAPRLVRLRSGLRPPPPASHAAADCPRPHRMPRPAPFASAPRRTPPPAPYSAAAPTSLHPPLSRLAPVAARKKTPKEISIPSLLAAGSSEPVADKA
nr:vegetative cell wall protein gp1-like [Aegilops tauschii subsp. strangulata]